MKEKNLRNEIKDLIKDMTNKTYTEVKPSFKFKIISLYYPLIDTYADTLVYDISDVNLYFFKNGFDREIFIKYTDEIKKLCLKYETELNKCGYADNYR